MLFGLLLRLQKLPILLLQPQNERTLSFVLCAILMPSEGIVAERLVLGVLD
jgi:hypothetical protein